MTEEIQAQETILYGEFSSIFKEDGKWTQGAYKLPDGTLWTYNEPDAVIIVQRNRLRVRVEPLTRFHNSIQLLDNFKHAYLSTERFPAPEDGTISFEVEMRAIVNGAKNNDLYNGFTAFNLHDLEHGFNFGFLTNGKEYASLYARQAPPSNESKDPSYPRFFEIYDEHPLKPLTEGSHHYSISYTKKKGYAEWLQDGAQVNYQDRISEPISSFQISIGIMTAVDLGPNGSQSIQGQGITGEWSQVKIDGLNTPR